MGQIGWEDVGRIHLALDKDQWRVLVNTVMNLLVPYKAGNFFSVAVFLDLIHHPIF
jgi:hypothetical protein